MKRLTPLDNKNLQSKNKYLTGLTYKKSGVDIKKASLFKEEIKHLVRKSFRKEVLKDIGSFGSLFSFPRGKYREPVLASSSDGVGTKLKIAVLANRHDTVGIDAVAMNVNDILCVGAEALFFLDYIAYSKLENEVLVDIVKGLNNGCIQAGCSLIGGETAQMPGFYKEGDYDVAGFCVGVVERRNIIDGSEIKPQDIIIGLESGGLHSNGFSLVRRVFSEKELKRMSSELLKPTRIYVKPVLSLLHGTQHAVRTTIKGIAHITGGAFYNKISRILPRDVDAVIDKYSWKVPEVFRLIQNKGNIADHQMYGTFNMGIGMVLITRPEGVARIKAGLAKFKLKNWVVGEITRGSRQVKI